MQQSMGPIARKEMDAQIFFSFRSFFIRCFNEHEVRQSLCRRNSFNWLIALYLRQLIRYRSAAAQILRHKATLYTFYTRGTTQHL